MSKKEIKGGTPVGSASLCRSCSWAHIMTGYRGSELLMICTGVGPNIPVRFAVYECTGYWDKNRPSYEQMQKFAIEVRPETTLKPVGFITRKGFAAATEDEAEEEECATAHDSTTRTN